MNSIEKLIQNKLSIALEEKKRKVAAKLMDEGLNDGMHTPSTKPVPPMKPIGTSQSGTQLGSVGTKKANPALQAQQKIQQRATAAKDVQATALQLRMKQQKLTQMNKIGS